MTKLEVPFTEEFFTKDTNKKKGNKGGFLCTSALSSYNSAITSYYKGRKYKALLITPISVQKYDIGAFAMYLKLKRFYNNSVIKNYNAKDVSARINEPSRNIGKYIKRMISEGLAYKHNNNIVLQSLKIINQYEKVHKTIQSKSFIDIRIGYNTKIQYIKDQLAFIGLQSSESRQKHMIEIRNTKINAKRDSEISLNKYKKLKKYEKSNGPLGTDVDRSTHVSSRGLGELLNVSHTEANTFINNFIYHGWINAQYSVKLVQRVGCAYTDPEDLQIIAKIGASGRNRKNYKCNSGYYFISKGNLFEHKGRVFSTDTKQNQRISKRTSIEKRNYPSDNSLNTLKTPDKPDSTDPSTYTHNFPKHSVQMH